MKQLLIAFVLCISSVGLLAQDPQFDFVEDDEQKDWGFALTPYAMLAAQSTDVGGEKIRSSFSDLSSITNAGFQIIAAMRYKRFTVAFDGTFATLGVNDMQGPLSIDLEIKQRILDFSLAYQVYDNYKFEENHVLHGWSVGVNVGAKYWKNDVTFNYAVVVNDTPIAEDGFNEPQAWWDLMIGAKSKFVLSRKVLLGVGIDIGGFRIGNSSKFSYEFDYVNSFKIAEWVAINAGFRSFRYKRIDGAGEEELETVVTVLGPLLGISVFL